MQKVRLSSTTKNMLTPHGNLNFESESHVHELFDTNNSLSHESTILLRNDSTSPKGKRTNLRLKDPLLI